LRNPPEAGARPCAALVVLGGDSRGRHAVRGSALRRCRVRIGAYVFITKTPTSSPLVLLVAEQRLAGPVVNQRLALAGQHLDTALHRRARADLVEPALQVRVVVPVDALVLPRSQPGEHRDVGDRVGGAAEVAALRQAPVHHAVQALRLVAVALDRVGDLLGRIDAEVVRLAEHRTDTAHLEHQPLQHLVLAARVRRQQATGLAGEVEQDRARFEQRDRLAVRPVGIDDRGDLVVRADREEVVLELCAGADVDRNRAVLQRALLQHDVDLVSVGRGPGIHFDHGVIPSRCRWCLGDRL